MRPINFTKEAKKLLFEAFKKQFDKEIESFDEKMNESKINLSFDCNMTNKEKITIMYTPQAYLRMKALVDNYDTEVGWYGLVEKISNTLYRVYDVKVCRQYVNGGKVDTEDEDTLEFFDSLTDDEAEHMHFQAHSHVQMSTDPSGVDLQNQADVVRNMGKGGFYIFQIWNKKDDINTYLYDLDANMLYNRKDIEIDIEDSDGLLSSFIDSTKDLVLRKAYSTWNPPAYKKGKGKPAGTTLYPYYGGGWDW